MKRLFYQTKVYDYSTVKEAEKHIKEMKEKNWKVKKENVLYHDETYIYENGQDVYPYSVEYFKEL